MLTAKSEEIIRLIEAAREQEKNGNRFNAIMLLEDANKRFPRKIPILYQLSLLLLENGNFDDVPKYAKQFLELSQIINDTNNIAKAYYILAETERRTEHYETALKYYKLGQKNDFFSYEFYLGLARCYQKQQKYTEALTNYEKAMYKANDEGIEAELRYTISELEERVPKLKEIADRKEKAQYNLNRCKYEAGKAEYQRLFELIPNDYELKKDYFSLLIKVKKYSEAIEFGEKLIGAIENRVDYLETREHWTILCMIYEGLIEAYNGTWHFIKALNSKSLREYYFLLNRGNYEAVFNKEKQLTAYQEAFSNSPNRPEAILKLISCYTLLHDHRSANNYVHKGLAIAEKSNNERFARELYQKEAWIFEDANQKDNLINSYNNMLKYCKSNKSKYQAHYRCACSLFILKDYKKAESELELCRQIAQQGIEDPEDIESLIVTCKAMQNPSLYGQKEDFF